MTRPPISRTGSRPTTGRADSKPGIADLLVQGYFNALRQPQKYLETVARAVPGLAKLATAVGKGELTIAGARTPPVTRFNKPVSSHRVFDGVPFSLAEVRAVKEAVEGATVNDVILTIIGGALRTYLVDKGELPETSMTAMAPISVRGEGEKAALGKPRPPRWSSASARISPIRRNACSTFTRMRSIRKA